MKINRDIMKKEVLNCAYCGGTLTHDRGQVWICNYCGKNIVLSQTPESSIVTCCLVIQHGTLSEKLEMTDRCTIEVSYKKRATMADPYPMFISIKTSEGNITLEEIENIGKGTITLEYDISLLKITAQGNVKYELKGPADRGRYLDSGASIMLGSASITIN